MGVCRHPHAPLYTPSVGALTAPSPTKSSVCTKHESWQTLPCLAMTTRRYDGQLQTWVEVPSLLDQSRRGQEQSVRATCGVRCMDGSRPAGPCQSQPSQTARGVNSLNCENKSPPARRGPQPMLALDYSPTHTMGEGLRPSPLPSRRATVRRELDFGGALADRGAPFDKPGARWHNR